MTTPAEQEAERRYVDEPDDRFETNVGWGKQLAREAFVAGVEWSESRYRELLGADPYIAFASGCEWAWAHPPDHIQELLEAAREFRKACIDLRSAAEVNDGMLEVGGAEWSKRMEAMNALLAAVVALSGGTDAERPPVEERPLNGE